MTLKNYFIPLVVFVSTLTFGQNKHSKMFGFVSDNDVYISTTQDQYFTNGLTLQYRYIAKTGAKNLAKKIYTIELGQYIYTPFRAYVPIFKNQDRPFAGYLFANFSVNKFYNNESLFKITYQLGILGPQSQAEYLQKWYHRTFGLPPIAGWQYQIQNQLGANINAFYLKNIAYTNNKQLDFNAFAQTKVGTIFDEASLGFISRIGFKTLNPIFNTILFNSNISVQKTNTGIKEFYFFVKPQLTYVAYNATIQGSLFNNNSPLTFNSKSIKASLQLGLKWSTNRFNFGYALSYITKAVDNNRVTAHKYGTISMLYKFE